MMKRLEEYMKLYYKMEITKDKEEEMYVVSFPDLKGCFSCGRTIDSAIEKSLDAKTEWFKAALEEGIDISLPDDEERYSGQFKLRIPKSLHRELAQKAKSQNVSMNQYCLYKLSKA